MELCFPAPFTDKFNTTIIWVSNNFIFHEIRHVIVWINMKMPNPFERSSLDVANWFSPQIRRMCLLGEMFVTGHKYRRTERLFWYNTHDSSQQVIALHFQRQRHMDSVWNACWYHANVFRRLEVSKFILLMNHPSHSVTVALVVHCPG